MDEDLVARIVARVVALLDGQQSGLPARRVLVLFSGATCGIQAGLEAIGRMGRAGHHVTVVLSPAAGALTGEDRVRAAGAQQVIGPGVWADAPGLVRASDLVLLPTLSMNLAARLALGLLDSLVSTLAIGALLAGKPVIAVRDGADPEGAAGRIFGAHGAPALRARLQGNLKTLAAYGIELVSESDFLAAVERHLVAPGKVPATATRSGNGSCSGMITQTGIVTQTDLAAIEPGGILHLSPGSRLTPLAFDHARRLGIQIVSD